MGKRRNSRKTVVAKPESKRLLAGPRCRQEDNIQRLLKKFRLE
jgi:hypothetical protein